MAPRVIITRTTPASTVPALRADAMMISVVNKITDTYKKRDYPTTAAAITAELQKTFTSVQMSSFGPEYYWEKNPVTCAYVPVCRGGSTITVDDGASGPVIVTIYEETVIV